MPIGAVLRACAADPHLERVIEIGYYTDADGGRFLSRVEARADGIPPIRLDA
jgi:hypothetical protein